VNICQYCAKGDLILVSSVHLFRIEKKQPPRNSLLCRVVGSRHSNVNRTSPELCWFQRHSNAVVFFESVVYVTFTWFGTAFDYLGTPATLENTGNQPSSSSLHRFSLEKCSQYQCSANNIKSSYRCFQVTHTLVLYYQCIACSNADSQPTRNENIQNIWEDSVFL